MFKHEEILTVIIAASPVLELRGALPFALSKGIPLVKAYFLAVAGNMLPVIPLLWGVSYFLEKSRKIVLVNNWLNWWFSRVEKKSAIVQTYGTLGLIFFVAIPLPTSGAWTGTLIAGLLKFRFLKAVFCVLAGVLISGLMVAAASKGVIKLQTLLF